jgi:hypothetical protein
MKHWAALGRYPATRPSGRDYWRRTAYVKSGGPHYFCQDAEKQLCRNLYYRLQPMPHHTFGRPCMQSPARFFSVSSFQRERKRPVLPLLRMARHESAPLWPDSSHIFPPLRPGRRRAGCLPCGVGRPQRRRPARPIAEPRRRKGEAFSLQPSAFCLLPSAFCLQPSAFCLQPSKARGVDFAAKGP